MWNYKRKKKTPKAPKSERQLLKEHLHTLVRYIVRARDNNTCVRCSKEVYGSQSHVSHFFNRYKLNVAWDLDNVDLLCFGCHRKIENAKNIDLDGWNYEAFKRTQLGKRAFDRLEVQSTIPGLYSVEKLHELRMYLSAVLVKYGIDPPPLKKPRIKKELKESSGLLFSKQHQTRRRA